MAYTSAPGYGNLPQGNWSPVVFSKKALLFFRTAAVAESITNTDYSGEIADMGDTVNIIKEPAITVQSYVRGQELNVQDIDDAQLQLIVDQGYYFAFAVDDIEKQFSHIDWESLAQSSAGYALTNKFDQNVLAAILAGATTSSALGTSGSPKTVGFGSGNDYTPLDIVNRMARLLDENDVPADGRWLTASPAFYEQLAREDSKLVDVMVTGDPESIIRNRKFATSRPVHGFTCFKSNNQPLTAGSNATILCGHQSAVATATSITKSEMVRREKTFGDLFKGLLVFGRKVLRPEALFSAAVTYGDA